jgi:O-acetyl-ADP-ribose deacetylase (regulator of RNase III)
MMREVVGDILLSKADAVVHGIAPNDHFTNGLALALRERWPGMYKDFRHYCQVSSPKPGTLWTWAGPGGVRIVSLFTQDAAATQGTPPGKAHLENVNHCLKALRHAITTEKFKGLVPPR